VTPTVSFIVPCYKLAHLLPECVQSILSQTYKDFEILIMDDCSPDNTQQVAQSFQDPRVKYIRNDPNLGHLRNYNKGISLAAGEYLWLISADDRLRQDYALEKYVRTMEAHQEVGYICCNGVGIENGQEMGLVEWSKNGEKDWIRDGRDFLCKLVHANSVLAPSGMVRRECYEKVGVFPLDLPYAGDWYLWCVFALHHDIAYISEPLVNYRLHGLSMTSRLTRRQRVADNLAVRWRVKCLAHEAGYDLVVRHCLDSLANHYAYCITAEKFQIDDYSMTFEEFEESLRHNAGSVEEARKLRASVFAGVGDGFYSRGQIKNAQQYYAAGLKVDFWSPNIWLKHGLLSMGKVGSLLRQGFSSLNEAPADKRFGS